MRTGDAPGQDQDGRKRPGKAIQQERWHDGMIVSQPMKEAICGANNLGSGLAKAQLMGKSFSSLAGEGAVPSGLLSKTRPESQEFCVLEKEIDLGKGCSLSGGAVKT
jgi:hypothetical protein